MSITTTATTNSSKRLSLQPTVEDCHSSSSDDDDDNSSSSSSSSSDSSEEVAVQPDVEVLREPPLQSPVGGSTKLASTTVKTASDSGYSSRTVATAASLDSAQSSDRTAVPAVAVTPPNVSSKKKKKKKSSSGEAKTQSKRSPLVTQTPQRAASRNDKTVHGSARDGAEHEQVRQRSRTSMGPPPLPQPHPHPQPPPPPPPPQPHAPPTNPGIPSYPYAVPVQPIPQFVHPPLQPYVSTAASPVRPSLFMNPAAVQQPRAPSLQYSQLSQFAPLPDSRFPPGHYFPQERRSRPTSLVIHPQTSPWPPTPESPRPVQTSSTLHQRILHSPTHERAHQLSPSPRQRRPTRSGRSSRPISLHVPVIHYDREAPVRSDQRQEPRPRQKPPSSRRESSNSHYHGSYNDDLYASYDDDIYYDDETTAHDVYSDMSDYGYDDYGEVSEYVPRSKHRNHRRAAHPPPPPPPSRRATDTLPVSLSRSRSNSYHPVRQPPPSPKEYAYHHEEDGDYYNDEVGEDGSALGPDPYATARARRRTKPPSSVLPRRPSTTITPSTQFQLASTGRRLSQVESERDYWFAAANRQLEADAEQYQAKVSGNPRKNTRNPLEDVDQQAGRRHTRSENRSLGEGSLDGSNMSDALKLTLGVQTFTITQGETGSTDILIEQNRRQTRYLHEGSLKSSGGTSRSSRQRPVADGNSIAGATTTKEGKTRPRKGTSRRASSNMQPRDNNYDDETM